MAARADLGPAHAALAYCRKARGDFGGARRALEWGVGAVPTYAPIWHAFAELEAILGNLDGLAQLNQRVLNLFPSGGFG